jgi:glycosyltransferase involved in cell wall biosynthesis
MDVDDVGRGERTGEAGRERVRRVPAEVGERAEHGDPGRRRAPSEADDPDVDVGRESAGELERVPLAAAEDSRRAEERRSDVDDPQLVLPLVTLGDPARPSGGYLYHRRMADAAPDRGARIEFVSFRDRPFPFPLAEARRVLDEVRALRPDALILDSIAAAFLGPFATRAGAPVVGSLHQPPGGIDHGRVRTRAQTRLDLAAWKRADILIAASDHLAEQVVDTGAPRDRIRVVPPGRDVAVPPTGATADLRAGRACAFLCVANWLPRKGIVELLDAFGQLAPDSATLHLAGDDAADRRYAARVRERVGRLGDRVVLHGHVSRERIASLYSCADAFVLPAYRDPYGTVWGEAMAFGLPVVGWHAANLPHLAAHDREGLLVTPGDVGALTDALARLASDEALRRRLGEAARARAESRPTWAESAELYFEAVREAVEGRQK